MTIVLADDHELVRAGIRKVLEDEPGFEVVAEAGDAETAARYVLGHKPSVLVLDLSMPGMPSLEALPKVFANSPDTSVVVLTMQNEPAFARKALQGGAKGYVIKHSAASELVTAIRAVIGGGTYINPELGARLAAEPDKPEGPPDELTPREVEVLGLLARGESNKQIAGRLTVAPKTVANHVEHIYAKIGVSSRAAATLFASQRGLVGVFEADAG